MKKILFMVSSMNIGGVEKSLLSLFSVIPKEKFDITVLLLEKKGDFIKSIPDWVEIKEATWFNNVKHTIMDPPKLTIKKYFFKKQYTKILSFLWFYFISKKFNNRYVYYKYVLKNIPTNNNIYDVAIAYQGPTDIIDFYIANKIKAKKKLAWVHFDVTKHKINQRLYTKLYINFDKVFVVSKEARKRLIEIIPSIEEKADVFLNIVPKEIIIEMSKESVEFDDSYHGIKIVTVGRLSVEKGQDIVINVLLKLLKDGYDVRWYCIGEGNHRKEYESLIEKNDLKDDFFLLGAKSNPYPYIARSDIYVQPSRHEGYCLTLAEALCLQKPTITTDFTGAYEQIKNGYNGFIVECNEEEVYKKVKYLIDNPKQKDKFVKNLLNSEEKAKEEVHKLIDYIK